MTAFIERFSKLRRPGILIRAAQFYLVGRSGSGAALLHHQPPPRARTNAQLHRLIDEELHLEDIRRTSKAEYSTKTHIEKLAEIIAIAQALGIHRPTAP